MTAADQRPLTDRIAEAIRPVQWQTFTADDGYLSTASGTAEELAAAVMAVVEPELAALRAERDELAAELGARDDKARKRWIKNQEKQLGIRFADFRAGRWEMDLAMGREMAAAYVAMAKTMLGDAPNYTETKLEFDVKIAESPEIYTLVVQRHAPGALTPHEARQRAEAEVERLAAELAEANEGYVQATEEGAHYRRRWESTVLEAQRQAKRADDAEAARTEAIALAHSWLYHQGYPCPTPGNCFGGVPDPVRRCGCPRRFGRHADGCPKTTAPAVPSAD